MSENTTIRLGTRGSRLALWQAECVRDLLSREAPMSDVEITKVKTLGDKDQKRSLQSLGRTGIFTAELDRALMEGEVDLAVHSLKDVETSLPPGMILAAVLPRGPVEDALLGAASLDDLPQGAAVGTGSARRRAQLKALRPDLDVQDLRGNVPTRLERLDSGDLAAIVLARAGLVRLGLAHRIGAVLSPEVFLPAVGQGAVAITCREDDARIVRILRALDHGPTRRVVAAERACLARLGGGCSVPLGVFGRLGEKEDRFLAGLFSPDGRRSRKVEVDFPKEADPDTMGKALAEELLDEDGRRILLDAEGATP